MWPLRAELNACPLFQEKHLETFSSLLPSPLEGGSASQHECHCLQLTSFQLRRNSLFHWRQTPQSWETLVLNQNYTHMKNYPFAALSDNQQCQCNERHASSPLPVSLDIAAEHTRDHRASKPSLPAAIKLSTQCCPTAAPAGGPGPSAPQGPFLAKFGQAWQQHALDSLLLCHPERRSHSKEPDYGLLNYMLTIRSHFCLELPCNRLKLNIMGCLTSVKIFAKMKIRL